MKESVGILQSGTHWAWFRAKYSTLTERFRYTSDTVFDTFPWPQFEISEGRVIRVPNSNKNEIQKSGTRITRPSDTLEKIRAVASAAVALRALRHEIMSANG